MYNTYINGIIPQFMNGASPFFYYAFLIFGCILCALISYVLGSFNFAMILSKRMYNQDIREFGSKNAGTTNMMRIYGKKAAFFTILGDILKGIVAVVIGRFIMGVMLGGYISAFFCIIGHVFPFLYKFKGGKGVATAIAAILVLDPFVFLILVAIFVLVVVFTRYISLGSVLCAAVFPLLTYYRTMPSVLSFKGLAFIFSFMMAIVVIAKHHENLSRLAHGTESKFSLKKSKDTNPKVYTAKKKDKK